MDPNPYNPYQAPQPLPPEAWGQPAQAPYPQQGYARPRGKPLGTYAVAAVIAIVIRLLSALVIDLLALLLSVESDLLLLFRTLAPLINLGSVLSSWVAVIFFLMWVHAAASNLRDLGRPGLTMSPGWCVGCFFVPFVNLVLPYQALAQIWDASDPGTVLGGRNWQTTPLLLVWWISLVIWRLLTQVATYMSKYDFQSAIMVELIATGIGVAALWAIVSIMRDVAASQKKLFES